MFLRLPCKSVGTRSDQWEVSAGMCVTTGFAFESNVLASPLPYPLLIVWDGNMMTGLRAAILDHKMEATCGGHQNPKREGILIWTIPQFWMKWGMDTSHFHLREKINCFQFRHYYFGALLQKPIRQPNTDTQLKNMWRNECLILFNGSQLLNSFLD